MLRAVRHCWAVVVALAVVVVSCPSIAAAKPPVECTRSNPRTGTCLLWASVPGSGDTNGGGVESGAVQPVTVGGDAAASDPCSYQLAPPQPPTGSAIWAGHEPEDGAIWLLICPRLSGTAPGGWIGLVYLPTGADPPAARPAAADRDLRALVQGPDQSSTLMGTLGPTSPNRGCGGKRR